MGKNVVIVSNYAKVSTYTRKFSMTHMDKIDAAILELLQKNNRLTSEELGDLVNLSPSACQRRLKRLRSEGIIEADVSIISPTTAGRPITMLVMVSLERERADIVDSFKNAVRKAREIMMGFYVTGDADFVLVLTAKSMEDYEEFSRKFFYNCTDIKSVKTMVVMDRIKASFEFPIDVNDPIFSGTSGN